VLVGPSPFVVVAVVVEGLGRHLHVRPKHVAAELDPGKDPRNVSRAHYDVGLKAALSLYMP
jgi:hypothetical protein